MMEQDPGDSKDSPFLPSLSSRPMPRHKGSTVGSPSLAFLFSVDVIKYPDESNWGLWGRTDFRPQLRDYSPSKQGSQGSKSLKQLLIGIHNQKAERDE